MQQEFVTSVLNHNKPVNLPYQLVLFDFDGTLCHTEGVDIYAIQKTYKILNEPIPTQETIQNVLAKGVVAEGIFQNLSPHAPFHFIQQLLLTYKAMYRAEAGSAKLFPGVVPLLAQLKEAGIISAVVSNKAIDLLEAAVTTLELSDYFEKVVGVREDGLCKPDPLLYKHHIEPHFQMVAPYRMLMVGDTSTDLRFAKAVQIHSAWASYGLGDIKSCKMLQPTYTLEHIEELAKVVLSTG